MEESAFSFIPEDIIFNIFFKLQEDPRNWARLACVCTKFSSIVRNICCKTQCYSTISTVISDLLPSLSTSDPYLPPPGDLDSLYKLAVFCPGLLNVDFGLKQTNQACEEVLKCVRSSLELYSFWSIYDDLYEDTLSAPSEESIEEEEEEEEETSEIITKRRKICGSLGSYLGYGGWNRSEEKSSILYLGLLYISKLERQ